MIVILTIEGVLPAARGELPRDPKTVGVSFGSKGPLSLPFVAFSLKLRDGGNGAPVRAAALVYDD